MFDPWRHGALEILAKDAERCGERAGAAGHDAVHDKPARVGVPQVLQKVVQLLRAGGACKARRLRVRDLMPAELRRGTGLILLAFGLAQDKVCCLKALSRVQLKT